MLLLGVEGSGLATASVSRDEGCRCSCSLDGALRNSGLRGCFSVLLLLPWKWAVFQMGLQTPREVQELAQGTQPSVQVKPGSRARPLPHLGFQLPSFCLALSAELTSPRSTALVSITGVQHVPPCGPGEGTGDPGEAHCLTLCGGWVLS